MSIFDLKKEVESTSKKAFSVKLREVNPVVKGLPELRGRSERERVGITAFQLMNMPRKQRRAYGALLGIKIGGIDSHSVARNKGKA